MLRSPSPGDSECWISKLGSRKRVEEEKMQKEIKTTLASKQLLQLCVLPSEGSRKVTL